MLDTVPKEKITIPFSALSMMSLISSGKTRLDLEDFFPTSPMKVIPRGRGRGKSRNLSPFTNRIFTFSDSSQRSGESGDGRYSENGHNSLR